MDCDSGIDDLCIEKLSSSVVCSEFSSCVDVYMGTECIGKDIIALNECNITEKCAIDMEILTAKLNFQSKFNLYICGSCYDGIYLERN